MWRCLFIVICGLVLATAAPAWAQPMPGGFQPSQKKKNDPLTKKKGPTAPNPATQAPLVLDPEKLPAGYEPPPAIPELMLLDEPLISDEEIAATKKLLTKYRDRLRKGEYQSKEDKELIDKGLRYRLYLLTRKDQERDLHKRREDLTVQDLRVAGSILSKADQQLAFRKYLMAEITKLIEPLFQNSFYVRLQAATLLGELELVQADLTKNIKVETYTPSCDLLIKVLDDPDQPLPVKIAAARSLVRLCKFAGVNLPAVELRHRIAKSVIAELAKPDTHYWYQMRLIEVLSTLDIAFDLQTKKPFIVTALLNVLNDPQRDWHARSEAAWALGRVPFDASVDVPGLMRDIMQYAHDLAKTAQQTPTEPRWKSCLFKVYLAFQPANAEDREATRRTRGGLLNSPITTAQAEAQKTYPLIVPITNAVLNSQAITAKMIADLDSWLQKAKPQPQVQANIKPNNAPPGQAP